MREREQEIQEKLEIEKREVGIEKREEGKKEKIVTPGILIGTEEEYLPGKGTYVDEEGIHSSVLGFLHIDQKRHVTVIPTSSPPELKVGSIVYGRIEELFESIAFVTLELRETLTGDPEIITKMAKIPKVRTFTLNGIIPISEIKIGYTKQIRDEIKIGDIIKGVVSKITPFRIEISLKGNDFGVIKAFCTKCRSPLKLRNKLLECTKCGYEEGRKLSLSYGKL